MAPALLTLLSGNPLSRPLVQQPRNDHEKHSLQCLRVTKNARDELTDLHIRSNTASDVDCEVPPEAQLQPCIIAEILRHEYEDKNTIMVVA